MFKDLLQRNKACFISIYEICLFLSSDTKESPKDILCCLIDLEKCSINREFINLYKQDSTGNYHLTKTRISHILGSNPANFDFFKNKEKFNNIYINTNEFKDLSFIKDEKELLPIHPKVINLTKNVRIEKKLRISLYKIFQDLNENSETIIDILDKKITLLLAENAKLNRQLSQSPNETIAELKQHNNELRAYINEQLDNTIDKLTRQAEANNQLIMQEFYRQIKNPLPLEDKFDEINRRNSENNQPLLNIEQNDISILADEQHLTNKIPIDENSRTQDPKIIAMMAILLADNQKCYKWGEKPNKSAIEKAIHDLIDNKFFIDGKHIHGLDSPSKRIGKCLDEFSEFFYSLPKPNKKN